MRFTAAALLLIFLLGCGSPAAPSAPRGGDGAGAAPASAAASPPALERVRLAYGAPSGSFAAPWMAKEAGLFERYGLDVEIVYVPSSPTMLQSMIAGELQFGELAAPASMAAYLEGGDVVWITGAINYPTMLVVARPEVRGLADLRDRPVGITRIGTTTHTFMKLAVRSAGLDPERDVQMLQTGGSPETMAALESGRIYAGVTSAPSHLRALEAGMQVLADLADLGIPWPFGGSITTKSYINTHPEAVRGYVKAYVAAVALLRTDRERSVGVFMKYGGTDDAAIAEQAWEMFRQRYAQPPYPSREAMATVVQEELLAQNDKARDVPPEAYYDDRFVRELDESGFIRQLAGS